MRLIKEIILHCSDTPENRDVDIAEIRRWHVEERGWSDIGYHYVIKLDGKVQSGRDELISGAHCRGRNKTSIGICVVGGQDKDTRQPKDTRTAEQKESLNKLLNWLKERHTEADVYGHNDFDKNKTCPNFSVEEYKQ